MPGSRRKNRPATELADLIRQHIEERNYLLFSIADRDPVRLRELNKWSLEGLYQFLYANSIHVRRMEAQRKTAQEAAKARGRR